MVWDISVAYYGCPYLKHTGSDLDEIYDAGFTSITLCVNEYEWPSMVRAKRNVIDKAHSIGLKVFIDIHGFGFFVPGHFSIAIPRNPEWCEIDNMGRIHPIRGCPNNPGYRSWLIGSVKEIIDKLKPDGIFWDEPSLLALRDWPNVWTCRCNVCRRGFRGVYGYDMPDTLNGDVREFRQNSIFDFLDDLMSKVKEFDGGLVNILCLMPEHTGMHGIYSWEPILDLKTLDVFSTDPYWIWGDKSFEWFVEWTSRAIDTSKRANTRSQVWVELIKVPRGREPDILRSVIKAVEIGADAIATWSFRAEEGSILSCEDPETAWRVMIEAIRRIKS